MKIKYILIVFLIGALAGVRAQAQMPSGMMAIDDNKHYYYEKVFQAEGKTKAEIFKAIKGWIVKNVKGQAVANYFDDAEMNSISTNPVIIIKNATVDFKLNVDIKDGRYKIAGNAFVIRTMEGISKPFGDYSGLFAPKSYQRKALEDVDKALIAILDGLEAAIKASGAGTDW